MSSKIFFSLITLTLLQAKFVVASNTESDSIHATEGIIAYDCYNPGKETKAISLHSIKECKLENYDLATTQVNVQMLQRRIYDTVPYYQCKVNVLQTIRYCGWYGRASLYQNSMRSYIMEVDQEECKKMHELGSYKVKDSTFMDGLAKNGSVDSTFTIYGSSSKELCTGATFSWRGETFEGAVMVRQYTIELRNGWTLTEPASNIIKMPSGMQCKLTSEKCLDVTGGNTFWSAAYIGSSCKHNMMDVLYQGSASQIVRKTSEGNETVIIVESKDISAAFKVTRKDTMCDQFVYLTEHPQIFFTIYIGTPIFYFTQAIINPLNVDTFRYTNAKFVYVEHKNKIAAEKVYSLMKYDHCQTRKRLFETQITIAPIDSEQFAYMMMNEPGYHATVAGEVVYISKCMAIEVKHRITDGRCFNDLPVEYVSEGVTQKRFMRPRSRMLVDIGKESLCNALKPVMYMIAGKWYTLNPHMMPAIEPLILDPAINSEYKAASYNKIGSTGIYAQSVLDLSERANKMGAEIPAMTNIITSVASGYDVDRQGLTLSGMLTDLDRDGFVKYYVKKTWGFAHEVGMIVTSLAGVYFIFWTIKTVVSLMFNFAALWKVFGWSWKLMAGVWGHITHYTLHHHHKDNHDRVGHAVLDLHEKDGYARPPSYETSETAMK